MHQIVVQKLRRATATIWLVLVCATMATPEMIALNEPKVKILTYRQFKHGTTSNVRNIIGSYCLSSLACFCSEFQSLFH